MESHDSPGCFVVVGVVIILLSLFGFWQATLALVHHTILYSFWGVAPWMDPWQAVAVFSMSLIFGLFVLVTALRKMKK